MNTPSIINARQQAETSSKEQPSNPKKKNFREFFENKVEKVEEREIKKRSIFEIIADAAVPPFPIPMTIDPSCDVQCASNIPPISKQEADWIVSEATAAITHCIDSGVKETTLRLEGAHFQTSPLYGTEIVITEFSTAPLAFNVEFRCSPTALAFLQPHLPGLAAAFHLTPKREFSFNRIDASLEDSSQFLFHRKPAAESGHNDRGG